MISGQMIDVLAGQKCFQLVSPTIDGRPFVQQTRQTFKQTDWDIAILERQCLAEKTPGGVHACGV